MSSLTCEWMNHSSQQHGWIRSTTLNEKNKLLQLICYYFFKTTCLSVVNYTTPFLQDKWMLNTNWKRNGTVNEHINNLSGIANVLTLKLGGRFTSLLVSFITHIPYTVFHMCQAWLIHWHITCAQFNSLCVPFTIFKFPFIEKKAPLLFTSFLLITD